MSKKDLRIVIVAEHASTEFGGEAALPLHYFRVLRKRNIETWLVVHERTRAELARCFPNDLERIYFIPDTIWHRYIWQFSKLLPRLLSYFTAGFVMRLMTQIMQRRLIKQLVQEQQITLIHQPIPVSPREPSMLFDMGAPVVIGPMNGAMIYPPGFQDVQNRLLNFPVMIGRQATNVLNWLIPGKRHAAALLVANPRTRKALPTGIRSEVIELTENGVDLSIWKPDRSKLTNSAAQAVDLQRPQQSQQTTKFVYIGRLVDWKAVDLLLLAFKRAAEHSSIELEIIGDGSDRTALENQAIALGLMEPRDSAISHSATSQNHAGVSSTESVRFVGWLSQSDCANHLQQADVLVLPSIHECGGAVVLEAMAVGLPVIATNWGGPADYVDESCGILVDPSSPDKFIDGLATAITRMAESPELRRAMGKAGYQRVLANFDWEVKIDNILDVYHRVIESTQIDQEQRSKQKAVGAI